MKKVLGIFFFIFVSILLFSFTAGSLQIGAEAPPFFIESADGKKMNLEMIYGNLSLIFYEDRSAVEKNNDIKHQLSQIRDNNLSLLQNFQIIQVVDASSANFLTKTIWKRKLLQNSRQNNIIIYADWTGDMLRDYHLKNKESNLIFIDHAGIIRYLFYGKINDQELKTIEGLLLRIARESL
ncbi:MAG: hypothetical protein GX428_12080 [Candidatus Atribacteria bacterium]|nr:hypothetical protein [Candidatus Atribacteria bacterium]